MSIATPHHGCMRVGVQCIDYVLCCMHFFLYKTTKVIAFCLILIFNIIFYFHPNYIPHPAANACAAPATLTLPLRPRPLSVASNRSAAYRVAVVRWRSALLLRTCASAHRWLCKWYCAHPMRAIRLNSVAPARHSSAHRPFQWCHRVDCRWWEWHVCESSHHLEYEIKKEVVVVSNVAAFT